MAIGFARAGFPQEKVLPGWIEGSYGYHGDDGCAFSGNGQRGESFGPPFGAGATVGLGIDTRTRTLYATLNGRLLGVAARNLQLQPETHAPLVPTIGVDYPTKLSINFGQTPFVFRLSLTLYMQLAPPAITASRRSISTPSASDTAMIPPATFDDLPNELVAMIIDFVVTRPREALILGKVSKTFYGLTLATHTSASANGLWRRLARTRWPHITAAVAARVDDWRYLYKRRIEATSKNSMDTLLLEKEPMTNVLIENCMEWKFKCPVALDKLKRTADSKIDYCTQCKENVYLCNDIEELKVHVDQGHCVAIDFDKRIERSRNPPKRVFRGRVAYRG